MDFSCAHHLKDLSNDPAKIGMEVMGTLAFVAFFFLVLYRRRLEAWLNSPSDD